MNAVLAFLVARWFLTFVGTALFAVLLWFFGPFLEFLESWVVRLVLNEPVREQRNQRKQDADDGDRDGGEDSPHDRSEP